MKHKELNHLLHRVSFGINTDEYLQLLQKDRTEVIDYLFTSRASFDPLKIDMSQIEDFFKRGSYLKIKDLSQDKRQNLAKIGREKLKHLNKAWIDRLTYSANDFREKMTLFWANVFVCRDNQAWFVQKFNNTLREHAFGNFGDFVKAIAREPAMARYLNNNQNIKKSPNENFARELMELFTLGAGNYSEKDIKEAARAFTGWSFRRDGSFFLRKFHHDEGDKTFFGKTGNFNGDDIIGRILEQKQCARFICEKIYRYFVNPVINEQNVSELTSVFYKDYNIEKLMRYLLKADWFYDSKNIGVKIKSPIELLVGIRRTVPFDFLEPKQLFYLQKMMGQVLLYPPNVAGWKGDRSWIDSNTLLFRMKLASLLLNDALINLEEKGDFKDSFSKYYNKTKNRQKFIKTTKHWDKFHKKTSNLSHNDLKELLLVSVIDVDTQAMLENLSKNNKHDFVIQLMSIPEYQMC